MKFTNDGSMVSLLPTHEFKALDNVLAEIFARHGLDLGRRLQGQARPDRQHGGESRKARSQLAFSPLAFSPLDRTDRHRRVPLKTLNAPDNSDPKRARN